MQIRRLPRSLFFTLSPTTLFDLSSTKNILFKRHYRTTTTSSIPTAHPSIYLPNTTSTEILGAFLARTAQAGDIIFLSGPLGAGKTSFARGFIRSARADPSLLVTSPTYLLCNTYPPSGTHDSMPTIAHMDLWRVQNALQRRIVDFDTVFTKQVALIEWPDRLGWIPQTRLQVDFEYPQIEEPDEGDPWGFGDINGLAKGGPGRSVSLQPVGGTWEERVATILRHFTTYDHDGRLIVQNG